VSSKQGTSVFLRIPEIFQDGGGGEADCRFLVTNCHESLGPVFMHVLMMAAFLRQNAYKLLSLTVILSGVSRHFLYD
jgi:hypothetical protein